MNTSIVMESLEQANRKEIQFERIISNLQEWFPDYYVAVRGEGSSAMWKSSDSTWAIGVCKRYLARQARLDELEVERKQDERLT